METITGKPWIMPFAPLILVGVLAMIVVGSVAWGLAALFDLVVKSR